VDCAALPERQAFVDLPYRFGAVLERGHSCLSSFPAGSVFTDGLVGTVRPTYEDQARARWPRWSRFQALQRARTAVMVASMGPN
jgi:hypothetical protein